MLRLWLHNCLHDLVWELKENRPLASHVFYIHTEYHVFNDSGADMLFEGSNLQQALESCSFS